MSEAAERALKDGDEGGFEFQNMLASEITEAWHIACHGCHGHGLTAFNCTWYEIDMDLALLTLQVAQGEDRRDREQIWLSTASSWCKERAGGTMSTRCDCAWLHYCYIGATVFGID